jgi:hypothetical protein
VSRDNSQDEFVQYYQHMPWLAVPMEAMQKTLELTAGRYQVSILYYTILYYYTHILIYSYTHILIYSYTHILIHSYTHILIYSYTHTLIY